MHSCLINSSTISLLPSCAARINAVLLNIRLKFHKSFNLKFYEKSKI